MIQLFRRFLKPFALLVIAACAFTFFQVLAELQLPHIMSAIVDEGIYNRDMGYVIGRGIEMLAWAVASLVCVVVAALCAARAAMGFGRDIRSALFSRVEHYSLFEFNAFGTSTLITRNTNDVQQLERFVQMLMTMAVMTPAMFIGAIVMAFTTNAEMASLIFFVIPLLVIVVVVFLRKGMPLLRSLQSRIDDVNRIMREGLQGVRVIRAYNKQDYEQKRFSKANRGLSETYVKVGRLMGALMPVMMLILNATIVGIYYFGAGAIDKGDLSAGEIMALVQYVTLILMSLMMVSMVFALMPRTLAACERILEVLDTSSSIRDDGTQFPRSSSTAPLLEMKDVSFCFAQAQKPSISNVSFSLPHTAGIAMIGPTGSGKTTIINLMIRLCEATEGAVFFNGVDVRDIPSKDLREHVSYVPQKATLFSGTLAENLRFGNPDADDERLWWALECAQAREFVESFDEGLDYRIAQGGENLSGGQRQRLAIARALVRDADLFIFDDSFSALDFKTDSLVRQGIRRALADKCVFIVTQRVSVAMDADEVIMLTEEGSIDAKGSHRDLFASCDAYRQLAQSQLSDDELAQVLSEPEFDEEV